MPEIMEQIREHYYVLEIDRERIFSYHSLYYDTRTNAMYLAHHNGKVNRFKVRIRQYVASDLCFLEIKQKIKGSRTVKHRKKISGIEPELSPDSREYISRFTPFNEDLLEAKIFTNFNRATLVSKALSERVTIDMNLSFQYNSHGRELDDVVIVELKRDGNAVGSNLVDVFNRYRILPKGFSKYCIGRAMVENDIKTNNFKERILNINKLNNGDHIEHTAGIG
jgi:uncharacterized protein YuzE